MIWTRPDQALPADRQRVLVYRSEPSGQEKVCVAWLESGAGWRTEEDLFHVVSIDPPDYWLAFPDPPSPDRARAEDALETLAKLCDGDPPLAAWIRGETADLKDP